MKIYMGPYTDDSDRQIDIELHDHDTWSMDSTLAHIIVPMLKQLKNDKQGYPAQLKDMDEWNQIMDEMIWAFTQINEDWEEQFYSGEINRISVPLDSDMNETDSDSAVYYEWKPGPNHTFAVDTEGMKAHQQRIQDGINLFAKHYFSLWD